MAINTYILNKWQDLCNTRSNNKLYKIKPTLCLRRHHNTRLSCREVILARIRIGYTNITHSFLLKKKKRESTYMHRMPGYIYCKTFYDGLCRIFLYLQMPFIRGIALRNFSDMLAIFIKTISFKSNSQTKIVLLISHQGQNLFPFVFLKMADFFVPKRSLSSPLFLS